MHKNYDNIQSDLLDQFIKSYQYPSMKQISKMTGIQETRVFRLLKGHEMKMHEYLRIKYLLDRKHSQVLTLVETIETNKERLGVHLFMKLQNEVEREIRFQELLKHEAA